MDSTSQSEEVRRSNRANKGQGPERLGILAPGNGTDSASVLERRVRRGSGSVSKRSQLSNITAATTRERIEIEAAKKKAILNKDLRDMEVELNIIRSKRDTLLSRLTAKKHDLRAEGISGVNQEEIQQGIKDLEKELVELTDKISELQIKIDAKKEENKEVLEIVEREKEVDLKEVADDDDLEEINSKDGEETSLEGLSIDKVQEITDWAAASAALKAKEDEFLILTAEDKRLTEEKQRLEARVVELDQITGGKLSEEQNIIKEQTVTEEALKRFQELLKVTLAHPKSDEVINSDPNAVKMLGKEKIQVQASLKKVDEAIRQVSEVRRNAVNYRTAPPPQQHYSAAVPTALEDTLPGWEGLGFGPIPRATVAADYPRPRDKTEQFLARQSHNRDLPFFSGKPSEWLKFKGAYERTTNVCGFKDDENLGRLEKALKDPALKSVESLMCDPSNVSKIMSKLERRYGQPQFIIGAMINKVRDSPVMKQDNLESIIEFGNNVENLVATLQTLNRPEHLRSPILLEELEGKLPVAYQMEWRDWVRVQGLSLDLVTFSRWLENKTEAACSLCPPKAPAPRDGRPPDHFKYRRNQRERVMVVAEESQGDSPSNKTRGNQKQNNEKKDGCRYCSKRGHEIEECRKFQSETYEIRNKWALENRACFLCLGAGHGIKYCRIKKMCKVDGCGRRHHFLFHRESKPAQANPPKPTAPPAEKVEDKPGELVAHNHSPEQKKVVFYKTIPMKMEGPTGLQMDTFLISDSCSGYSIIDFGSADNLKLKKRKHPFSFRGMGFSGVVPDSYLVELTIIVDGKRFNLKDVQTGDLSDLPVRSLTESDLKKWKHLDGIPLKTYNNAVPKLLLGIPHAHLIETLEMVAAKGGNGPIACRCKLGWSLTGTAPRTLECPRIERVFLLNREDDQDLHEMVKEAFKVENLGVKIQETKPRSKEDKRAEMIMETTAKRLDKQFEIGLLWKEDHVKFPESYGSTFNRLQGVEKKMDRDPRYAELFCNKFREYQEKGYCRKLSQEEAEVVTPETNYLPFFGVVNPNKPAKFRLVFDAKAKNKGISLNDKLLQGPDYVPSLPAVLCRFRQRKIGFTADIADMFHMVKIRKEDQSAQRFLWREMDRSKSPDVYVMQCMIFGAASSPSCAQYIKNRNAKEVGMDRPEAVADIIRNHYVDDYPGCTDTVEEATKRFQDVTDIHAQGGFKITKWISNSEDFNNKIPEDLKANGLKNMELGGDSGIEKVLGLHWDSVEDIFTFVIAFHKIKPDVVNGDRKPTKREALALVMSVYDPPGFLTLLSIKARILLQDLWRLGIEWDQTIPISVHHKWDKWIDELKRIDTFKVPRCYSPHFSKSKNIQLHVFVDGSEQAYSAVGYFRIQMDDQVDIALVMSKARVAPLKPISIPRMELMGSILGTRMAQFIISEHDMEIQEVVYWTDSTTVLKWIRADGRLYKQFVACRIGEIQEVSKISDWRWVPTAENVADEATRDNKPSDWSPSSRWVNGPAWLKLSSDHWPKEPQQKQKELTSDDQEDVEKKKEYLGVTVEVVKFEPVVNITRFSSWIRLMMTTLVVLKFIRNCKKRSKFAVESKPNLPDAERNWWRWSQQQSFGEEVKMLKEGKELSPKNRLSKLSPFLDDQGVLRMQGRIPHNADVYEMDRNPVILHPKHPYTILLIQWYHVKAGHHGMERVVNDLRQNHCIPNIRAAVKRVWYLCQTCKNRKAEPCQPRMGELPLARLSSRVPVFSKTGVDFFGPFAVTIGRRHEKRYGCLFTCLTTRAVSIEMAASLSTDSFMMALRRFMARRGCPTDIYSDNGTNFVGAAEEIKKAVKELQHEEIQDFLTVRGVQWHFDPPAAPHMGGVWEIMVKRVKVAIYATLKERAPKEEVLHTVFAEAEHTVNARPLTHVPVDPEDPEALTPNHFLIGRTSNLPLWRRSELNENVCLRKLWEQADHLANLFWKRWVREYLPTLIRREKWLSKQKPLEIDDVVILVDPSQPRNSWPLGRIVAVYPGKDGQVRIVDVKTSTGTYRRPAVKVCRLDVRNNNDNQHQVSNEVSDVDKRD